jgi:peptidoglycan/LPS O-acetylase OafA/YrhL
VKRPAVALLSPPLLEASPAGAISGVKRSANAHIAELDGIRALAIWGVFVVHLFFVWPTNEAGRSFIPMPLADVLSHGWLGVDLFFVLSGFLITRILLATKHHGRKKYFRLFYKRRVLRILPLVLVVIAALLVAFRGQYATYFAYCAFLSANLVPPHTAIPDAGGPFWSLAVEEQFYLVWPWLVLWLSERRLMIAAVSIIIIEVFARIFANAETVQHTYFRLDGLAMGAFLAIWFASWNGDRRSARNLALVLVGAAVLVAAVGYPLGIRYARFPNTTISQAVCLFGAAMTIAIAYSGHRALSFLRAPFLALTAALSYSLYLVHRPVIDGLLAVFGNTAWYVRLSPVEATLLRAAVVVPIAYAVALLTRRFIEAPFIRLGRGA